LNDESERDMARTWPRPRNARHGRQGAVQQDSLPSVGEAGAKVEVTLDGFVVGDGDFEVRAVREGGEVVVAAVNFDTARINLGVLLEPVGHPKTKL